MKYFIEVQRECDEPAQFHVESDTEPTEAEVKKLFKENGYEDDWDYIGRIIIQEVFKNQPKT